MKKYLYLFIISISLVSCYTYRAKTEKDVTTEETPKAKVRTDESAQKVNPAAQSELEAKMAQTSSANKNKKQTQPTNIEEKLEANKYFKIEAGGKPYKIQVDKWESDTLVAHVIHKPKKILKFHKNQINQSTIAERRFSQPTADIITVVAYAAVGVGIWALVK